MTGLVLALGAGACGSEAEVITSDGHAAEVAPASALAADSPPIDSPPAEPSASPTPPEASDPGVSEDDGAAEADESKLLQPVPPRELDLPSYWSEAVAGVCRSDGDICAEGECPTFDGVLDIAGRDTTGGWAVRDYCVSDDGEPFITLGFTGGFVGTVYVFRAGSGEVVSRIVADDGPYHCADTAPSNREVSGRFIPDCMWVRDAAVPCTDQATPNLGAFENCFYDLAP